MYNLNPNTIGAMVSVVLMVLVWRAYYPLRRETDDEVLSDMFKGILWSVGSIGLRFIHWDFLRAAVVNQFGLDGWAEISAIWGGIGFNIVYHAMLWLGLYYFFRAKYRMIPVKERVHHNLLSAIFYPSEKCMTVRVTKKLKSRGK